MNSYICLLIILFYITDCNVLLGEVPEARHLNELIYIILKKLHLVSL
jgi:hypothetical protein